MWDFIIVGAGSSGAAIAARLSEKPSAKVLLIEAGPNYRTEETPEEMWSPNPFKIMLPADPRVHERYHWKGVMSRRTEKQDFRPLRRGRGVGGSSAINGETAIRGVLEAFDLWAANGCEGWSGADVLPYFCRLENDQDFGSLPYHGKDGPIPICRIPVTRWGPVDLALREAAMGIGYQWADDHNAPGATGVANYAMNSRDGRRVSTNDGYLEPARARSNLKILGEAHAERVLFDGRRATGVQVRQGGESVTYPGREIIVACGAVHSPAVLMRSGVGPAADLQRLGIGLVADLPGVGENLVDHPVIRVEFELREHARVKDPDFRHTNCCVRYSSGLGGGGFNDVLLFSINHGGFNDQMLKSHGNGGFFLSLFESFSRGRLTLGSPDPMQHPTLEPRMLSDERDLIRMRDGARRLFQLGRQPAVQAIAHRVTVGMTGIPLDEFPADDDGAMDDWMLAEAADCAHSAGTCRMGAPDDKRSVVDPDCRVYGVEGLRVADASIMPYDCRANLHLTAVMIGEHAADRISRHW